MKALFYGTTLNSEHNSHKPTATLFFHKFILEGITFYSCS